MLKLDCNISIETNQLMSGIKDVRLPDPFSEASCAYALAVEL